jgi:hypothetical protein
LTNTTPTDADVSRLQRILEIKNHALDRWTPCPDHRDKVPPGECSVCYGERTAKQSPTDADVEAVMYAIQRAERDWVTRPSRYTLTLDDFRRMARAALAALQRVA